MLDFVRENQFTVKKQKIISFFHLFRRKYSYFYRKFGIMVKSDDTLDKQNTLIKGEKYSEKFLQENNIEFVSESTIYKFFRKGIYVYVFDKMTHTGNDEYYLATIWKD